MSAPVVMDEAVESVLAFLSTLPSEGGFPLTVPSKSLVVPSPNLSITVPIPFFK